MGKLFTPTNLSSGFNTSNSLNTDLSAIEAALDKCVSRDGEAPNTMNSALDMNNYNILNVDTIDVADLTIDGATIPSLSDVVAAQTASEAAQAAAETAQSAAETAEANAEAAVASVSLPTISGGDAGKLLEVNPGETAYQLTSTIDTAQITDLNVTEAKLAAGAVTADKIGASAVTASKINDLAVTTAKINNGAVTAAKLDASILTPESLTSGSFTAASTQDLATLFSAVTTYEFYRLYFRDIKLTGTGTGTLNMRVSIDGSTFRSTASDYAWRVSVFDVSAAAASYGNSSADTEIDLTVTAMSTDDLVDGYIDFWFPKDATRNTVITSRVICKANTPATVSYEDGLSAFVATTDDITGIQFLSSGTKTFQASGTYELFGSNVAF